MTILERMARALETRARECGAFNYIKASYLTIDGKEPHPRAETFALADIHEAARAARDAMVQGLTDWDLHELRQHRPTFEKERGDMKAMNDYTRAALVAATEVEDGRT